MKPLELYALWTGFQAVVSDAEIPAQARAAMGREIVQSLPSPLLCSHSQSTLEAVKTAMNGRLETMEKELGARTETRKEEVSPQLEESGKGAARTRKKPVRPDATD